MFDSHAHYDDERFDSDRDELLTELLNGEIEGIVNAGCDVKSSLASLELAHRYKGIYAAVGFHPENAADLPDGWLETLRNMLTDEKAVAIGEIGLDYHYDTPPREVQKEVFASQLALAAELDKPVVVHDRDAHGDCLALALESGAKGVFHCFSGSPETAALLVKAGWYISVSGVVTYKNAARLPEVVASLPLERILIETDCPYLAPVPYRGKRNHSGYMKSTVASIASIRGVPESVIVSATTANAKRIFRVL